MKSRILIADRDRDVCDSYRLFLEGCGYEVDVARNGLECFESLIAKPPATLVLELGLLWGGADGVVCRMREDWDAPSVPVVLIAGEGLADGLAELVVEPVIDCLRKPFYMSDLLRCLVATEPGDRVAILR